MDYSLRDYDCRELDGGGIEILRPKNSNITLATVPEGVVRIGDDAFSGCGALICVRIPSTVKEIGERAFRDCAALGEVRYEGDDADWREVKVGRDNLPLATATMTYEEVALSKDGDEAEPLAPTKTPEAPISAKSKGRKAKGVAIGVIAAALMIITAIVAIFGYNAPIKKLAEEGFICSRSNDGITLTKYTGDNPSVTIPDSITAIGKGAFEYSKVTDITMGNGVRSIGEYAFKDCELLKEVTMGYGVGSIAESAFLACPVLYQITVEYANPCYYSEGGNLYTESMDTLLVQTVNGDEVTVPEGVKHISRYAFASYDGLRRITLPHTLTEIDDNTFVDNLSLEYVYIGDGVRRIGFFAFMGCSSLTEIRLGKGLVKIEESAFGDCNSLSRVEISNLEAYAAIDIGNEQACPTASGAKLYLDGVPVTSVTLQEGVTKIGDYAFYRCLDIEYLNLPDTVTSVGSNSFSGVSPIEAVIPGPILGSCALNTANLVTLTVTGGHIPDNGLKDAERLQSLTLSDSIARIGKYAINNCPLLTEITMPASLTEVGSGTFTYCRGITAVYVRDLAHWCKIDFGNDMANPLVYGATLYADGVPVTSLTIPEGITRIGSYSFYKYEITDLTLPDSLTEIGDYAFYQITGLQSLTLGGGLSRIGKYAFAGCEGITALDLPSSLQTVGEYAFAGCTELTDLPFPTGVTTLMEGAFYGCTGLTYVEIPDNLTSIGKDAFRGCSSLGEVAITSGMTFVGSGAFADCPITTATAPCIALEALEKSSLVTLIIAGGDTITQRALSGCTTLVSVMISGGVTAIGYGAFSGCTSLTGVYLPDGLTAIENGIFSSCTSLTSITLPDGLTAISKSCFNGCTSLAEIDIPASVREIGDNAFYECTALTSITLPTGLTAIGESAFAHCESIQAIALPDGVTELGDYAFYCCYGLRSVKLSEGLTAIGGSVFSNCSALLTVTLPQGVTSIGQNAFDSCSAMTSVYLPDTLKSIGGNAFFGCSKLTDIYFVGTEAQWNAIEGLSDAEIHYTVRKHYDY